MSTRFDTSDYQFSHSKLPRGTGGWAFSTEAHGRGEVYCSPCLSYTEAKKKALLALPNASTIYVLG